MASRSLESCAPLWNFLPPKSRVSRDWLSCAAVITFASLAVVPASAQVLLKPSQPGELVNLLPSDLSILEAGQERKDLPCNVSQRKPDLGFDLRFHAGFDVTLPVSELVGDPQLLTVVFRVTPTGAGDPAANFSQHFSVPAIADDAKGNALLEGVIDLGEGSYHVDWLMRDREERVCATSWDIEASLSAKDKPIPLFLSKNRIEQTRDEPFFNESFNVPRAKEDNLSVKLLVNFAPQNAVSSAMQRSDTDALVSLLKTIERDPRVTRLSLVAFNMSESKIMYRQEAASEIDFAALGKALRQVKLGTVNVQQLSQKHSETEFLASLITSEITPGTQADAVIFAGPKAMLDANVPQEDLRRIGDIECPVFYMNYTLDPQAAPWKDSISHAIRSFKGTEYTISRPRDLWFSTVEMFSRIVRSKHERALSALAVGGSR